MTFCVAYKMDKNYHLTIFLFLILLLDSALVYSEAPHFLRADVKNNLNDNSACPGWTSKLQWAIKSDDCESEGGFTPVACVNDQTKKIIPGAIVKGECQLNELPPGDYETYCLRVIWCQKEPKVYGYRVKPQENKLPVAVAKVGFYVDQASKEASLDLGEGMRFFAGDSSDPDGNIISYEWDYGDGKKEKTLSKDVHHSYTAPGEYTATLTVTDNVAAKATDTVKVTVNPVNVAIALAGTKPDDMKYKDVSIKSGEKVYFDGSGSTVTGPDIVYAWDYKTPELLSTPFPEGKSVEMSFKCTDGIECDYPVYLKLKKKGSDVALSADYVAVRVAVDPNVVPPVADARVGSKRNDAGYKKVTVRVGETVYLNCSGSKDKNGQVKTCGWTILGKSSSYTKYPGMVTEVFDKPWNYAASLMVLDDEGAVGMDEATIEVIPWENNQPPKAVIKLSDASGPISIPDSKILELETGETINLDASESSDPDGQITYYEWYVNDVFYSYQKSRDYIFQKAGAYTLELVVQDDKGGVGREKLMIGVKEGKTVKTGYKFVLIPMDWTRSIDEFNKEADQNMKYLRETFPVAECPEIMSSINLQESCKMEINKASWSDWANKLHECADAAGINGYDYVVGIGDDLAEENVGGIWIINTDVLLLKSGTPPSSAVLAHELGHALGLINEYYDECRCENNGPNCLDPGHGGGDANMPVSAGFCAGGNQCTTEAVCKGNLNEYGGRCIMSFVMTERPRAFCRACLAYLSGLPELKCGDSGGDGKTGTPESSVYKLNTVDISPSLDEIAKDGFSEDIYFTLDLENTGKVAIPLPEASFYLDDSFVCKAIDSAQLISGGSKNLRCPAPDKSKYKSILIDGKKHKLKAEAGDQRMEKEIGPVNLNLPPIAVLMVGPIGGPLKAFFSNKPLPEPLTIRSGDRIEIILSASRTADPKKKIVKYDVDYGIQDHVFSYTEPFDGIAIYDTPGTYSPKLTVTDEMGQTSTVTASIVAEQSTETCAQLKGSCSCPDGQECLLENKVYGSSDCADTCCRCVPKVNAKLTIIFVPIDWTTGFAAFKRYSDEQVRMLLEQLPLKECPSKLKTIYLSQNCIFDLPYNFKTCNSMSDSIFMDIESCARKSGQKFDYIAGFSEDTKCEGNGFASGGANIIYLASTPGPSLLHEIGHEWGLDDEYYDSCRCNPIFSHKHNCLDPNNGGKDSVALYTPDYCAGGSKCKISWSTCLGNKNLNGGRCIMGDYHSNLQGTDGFCPRCLAYLNSNIDAIKC